MLPTKVRKKDEEKALSMPPPLDYLAEKHTFSSMKKLANKKTRKKFNFDEFTAEQLRLNNMLVTKNSNKMLQISKSTPDLTSL